MNIKDIDLNLLIVFRTIYELRSVSRSADALDMSQPALSNALKRLRDQLGDPLFVRKGQGVEPTPRAREISTTIADALNAISATLENTVDFDPENSKRNFRIVVADPLEPIVLPSIVRKIQDKGDVTLELIAPQAVDIQSALLEGAADIAIFVAGPFNKELQFTELMDLDLVLVARQGHPGLGQMPLPELFDQYGSAALNLEQGALRNNDRIRIGQKPFSRTVVQVSRVSSIPQLLAQTDLLAFLPKLYAEQVKDRYHLQTVDAPFARNRQSISMIWNKKFDRDNGHIWLRQQIHDALSIPGPDVPAP